MKHCQGCGREEDLVRVGQGLDICAVCQRIYHVVKSKAPTIDDQKALEVVRDVIGQFVPSEDVLRNAIIDTAAQGKFIMRVGDDGVARYGMADWFRAQLDRERADD